MGAHDITLHVHNCLAFIRTYVMLLACEYSDHCCFPIAAKNCLDYAELKSDPIDELFEWHCNAVTELLKLKLVEEKTEGRNMIKERKEESKEYDSKKFFKCLDSKRMIIIQGKPGAGKTTFMRTICRDWEKGEIPEFSNKTLILVTLRDLKPDCSIKDILMQSCLDETCDYLNKCLTHRGGEHFVFLLDGLDEYHSSLRKNDIEEILCTRDKLKNATIVVTSRSSAPLLEKIPSSVCHTFQIDDINKEQVLQYFAKHEEVKKHLEENPNILQLCYVPLHCAMLKDIFKYYSDRPTTETLFFKKHTEFRITRALNYIDELKVQLDELMQGRDENATLLRSICEFAYNATEESNNLAFDENSEFVKHFLDASKTTSAPKRKGINRLGLLVIYPDTSKAKASRTNLYSFGHLTSQEFLAGCHIAYQLLPMKEPKEIINETGAHLRNAWKFACGLLFKTEKRKEIFVSLMKEVLQTRRPENNDLLFMIQCAHETQQKEMCEVVYEYLEKIELNFMTPQEVSVFIKTIEQTSELPRLVHLK